MPPVMTPQTGPAKRGPKMATAAQGNYLANQAARRPTVTPTMPPGKPSPFSASGPSPQPPASSSAGMSASGASSIPAASAPGASSTPASLNQVPSGSTTMERGGSVKRYAAGGTTETNQYGSWGGANAANAVAGASAPTTGSYGGYTPLATPPGPFSTTAGQSPLGGSYKTPAEQISPYANANTLIAGTPAANALEQQFLNSGASPYSNFGGATWRRGGSISRRMYGGGGI